MKAVGGIVIASGSAAIGGATSWTGVGAVAGGAGVVYGADVTTTGFKQMWTGENENTLTNQAMNGGLQMAGVSPAKAQTTANYAEFGLGLFLGGSSVNALTPEMNFAANATKLAKANPSMAVADLFTVNPNKFNYFFGKVVTGDIHNITRSADNLRDLTTLGVTNENQLMSVFNQAFKDGSIISTKANQFGTTIMKSINIGNQGSVGVGFFYEGGNMSAIPSITTLIPKIFK